MMGPLGYQAAIERMNELRASADKARRASRPGRGDERRAPRQWLLRLRPRMPHARRRRLTSNSS